MKIDRSKLKKNSSEAPGDCGWLIEKLHTCSDEELLPVLKSIDSWSYGKCELHHWVNVLDRFDSILENATKKEENQWVLPCDVNEYAHNQELVVWVLYFTTLLVEHSFSRHLYSSVEHLITLLSSSSMTVILSVLNLLYMFSKRSNYITRLTASPRQALLSRLIYLAESWGGKENGFGLAQCCQNLPLSSYPDGATTLHFEFYREQKNPDVTLSPISSKASSSNSSPITIHINNIQSISNKTPAQIMDELLGIFKVPVDKQMILFTHLRLAHSFAKYETRLQCVQARLQAISILVYCNALQDNAYTVLYSGLLDEFVDVLELKDTNLTEIKAATLRTLTSIIHLERYPNFPKLTTIIDVTGASSYHGFLPVLVRSCISSLTSSTPIEPNPFPAPLATSLFSFLYHLASYEAGGEALVSCGMMESLLSVVSWVGTEPDHITFVTRAVRVIDLITNLDMNAFQNHGGLNTFIKRLELEVNECRKEQPFVIQLPAPLGAEVANSTTTATGASSSTESTAQGNVLEMIAAEVEARDNSLSPMDVTESADQPVEEPSPIATEVIPEAITSPEDVSTDILDMPSTSKVPDYSQAKTSQTCLPQRAALLKSMLNFLKKDIQDPGFSESMRHLMESSLPSSLKHIISNAEYYGPSLFLLATDVVTVYVFGEPSLLSSLQDNGLTDVVLHALLVKDVPATREVLASLPNVFSALCLNSRGLQAFVACKPFERLFKVLLSPDYLPAMRRRKSSDPMGDTASNLGNAMDELMRHQPSLKAQAMIAIVKLLEEVCLLGSDAHYVCWKTPPKTETTIIPTSRTTNDNSSDEDDDEEEERETAGTSSATLGNQDSTTEEAPSGDKRPVPLVDYVLNVMKFVDAILSNNSTDDHCKEFVTQKGLIPLLGILGLPNLPIDFPVSQACQAVASVCKSILNLAHESGVLEQGLQCLHEKLEALAPLHEPLPSPGGSVLLRELASSSNPGEATNSPQSTPLLHTLSAIHAYIMMLVHVCRTGQTDIRQVSIKQWGTELGLKVLSGLTKLYTSLVWESTVLLALCSDDVLPVGCLFGKEDTAKLIPSENRIEDLSRETPMEMGEQEGIQLTADNTNGVSTSSDAGKPCTNSQQMKMIKPLLSSASRLGKALAELFGLLVKLCVGSPLRQRRGQQVTTPLPPPSAAAIAVANALSNVLYSGLSWMPPTSSPFPKFRLTFLICSVRFTNPMLFDDKKMPYHLMLQHFVKSQGLKAFFDIFNWAITTDDDTKESESKMDDGEEKNLPEGTGEFLDTWLFLLEKLVNPKTMIESPHSLPTKLSFCPLKFLIQIHKLAFESVMKLWNKKPLKNYGVKISESVLVILCSILKGEGEIAEKLNKENPATPTPSESSSFIVPAPTAASMGVTLPVVALTVQRFLTTEAGTTSATGTTTTTTATSSSEPTTDSVSTTASLVTTTTTTTSSNTASISTPESAAGSGTALEASQAASGASASTESRPLLLPYSVPPATSGASSAASNPSDVSYPYLQALLDMGFPQERCLEAISHSHSLEQATEFLLSNPLGSQSDGDMDFSEDDQWLQAVAMSLRETHQPSTSKPPTGEAALVLPPVVDEEPLSKEKLDEFTSTVLEGCLSQLDFQPQLVYKVCELLTTCVARNGNSWREKMLKTLMSQISEQASELTWMAGQESSSETAEYLCSSKTALKFAIRLHLVTLLFEEMKSGCAGELEEANLIEVLIELLCSAQEVMSANPHILTTSKEDKKLKDSKETKDKEDEAAHTPKWLAPAMLLLDLYEKLSVATKRRAAVKKVTNHVWKWFDVSQVKWYGYTQSNNKIIDDAYWAGESSVRIVNSRRKYTIQFHTMLQVNEETGNRRPVMISISEKHIEELKKNIDTSDPNLATSDFKSCTTQGSAEMEGVKESEQPLELTKPKEQEESEAASEKMEYEESSADEEKSSGVSKPENEDETEKDSDKPPEEPPLIIKGFVDNHKERMIRACVGFMKLCIEPDTLNALMRLCLRITREWSHACLFASLGGVRTLLALTETSSFWGFHSLAALLMRHILEEPNTLRHTMKKVVRFSAGSSSGMGARELHSLLRVLAPAACRDSNLFTEIAQQCLRIDLNMALKRNLMTTSNEDSILMKSIGSKSTPLPSGSNPPSQSYAQLSGTENSEPQVLVHDLMEALATTDEDETTSTTTQGTSTTANGPSTCVSTPNEERNSGFPGIGSLGYVARQLQLSRSSSANDMVVQDMDEQSPMDGEANKVLGTEAKAISTEDSSKKKKSLLSKSTLCKLLAEFIRSYAGVAKLVTDHQYSSGVNDKILEDCSALAYLLDQLVCGTGDNEMVNHVRVLIAALASCNHAPDAQATLVSEVKCCLSRVMCLPESPEKHTKIQSLVGLILTMMESCPTQINQPVNNTCYKQQMGMNNMIRIMIKKNLVTDLARIPHCLDLSSPNMATTINAALKPLETVLRIVNMPSFVSVPSSKKKSVPSDDQQQSGASISNSEATRAQGDENIDDTENTEHDISGTGESLEPTSEANPSEDGPLVEGDEAGLEEILDRFLDDRTRSGRDSNRGSSHRDTVTTTVAYVIDHGAPMDTDDTLHDSRMVTQSESQFLDETEDERNDDNDDESSSDDNDGDDEDNEEEVEVEDDDDDDGDDDDDDDDDDDEDDEEEGSVFDQGYDELEEAFIRLPVERENDDVLLMPSYQQYINTIDTIIFGDRISLAPHTVSHDDNLFMTSTPNTTNTNATSAIPTHPLFQNPREVATPITRLANRPSRQRGVLRYQSVTPRSHSTTTTILQRLLGQTHRDVLQLTSNIREATQFIIGNQDVRIIQQNDDFIEPQELETNLMNSARTSNSGTMPGVPNALTRWMEEARVLESDSFHDAVTQVKPALMAVLEKYRDAEQAERDKKKKEEAATKASADSKRSDSTTAEGEGTSSVTSAAPGTTIAVSSSGAVPTSTATSSSTTANGSAHNLIISILEQHFSSGSHTSASTASPTFTGLLTQLTPSSATGPSMSIQEPPTTPALPEASLSTPTFPIYESSLPINVSVATSLPTSTLDLSINSLPVVTSGFISITPTVSSSSVEILSSPLMSAPLPTILSDSAMSPTSPSIPLAPSIVYQLPSSQSSSLSQPTIDEAMSVSPPEFSNVSATPAIQTDETSQAQTDMGPEESNTTTSSSDQMPTEDALSESISQALSPMDQQMPSLEGQENSAADEIEEERLEQPQDPNSAGDEQVESGNERLAPSTSGSAGQNDFTAILGDIEIPEGVDPSFLAALPEDMRQEVISEQLRIQRVRDRTTEGTQEPSTQEVSEVSAEFLAALPPSIQEEVLAQQRLEQQRQQAARANPDDPTSFLLSLPQSLRQTILSDLEDSQFSALPTEVVQEAQTLRRQREDRSRHVHEHMFSRGGSSSISHILRTTARMGPRFMHSPSWSSWNVRPTTSNQQVAASSKIKGQQILDHEAMTCLLVLLFVDEPKLNTTRLHRVLKSLCQHPPTREWVIKTLLSIIERCGSNSLPYPNGRGLNESEAGMSGLSLEMSGKKGDKGFVGAPATSTPTSSAHSWKLEAKSYQNPTWLSMSMDAALGCRANIFQIQRSSYGGKKTPLPTSGSTVHIHPQAAPLVCRHAIDLLISLAKIFPSHFLPSPKEAEEKLETKKSTSPPTTGNLSIITGAVSKGTKTSSTSGPVVPFSFGEQTDFWELLVKLDSISVSRKGKGLPRTHLPSTSSSDQDIKSTCLETSPLGQLIQQLAHPVIKRSSLLTDRLLRLLALVSLGHSDTADIPIKQSMSSPESSKALEHLLGLSIQVLTSKSCSEEGLEDATALLLHLSHGPPPARDLVLKLLLQGAATLGQTVTVHINALLEELIAYNVSHPPAAHEDDVPHPSEKAKKGVLKDRFTCDQVVITSSKVKPPCEVQLPSMSALTSKTSSQAFFLRTLKVIIQLREAIRLARNRKNKSVSNTTRESSANALSGQVEQPQSESAQRSQSAQDQEASSADRLTPPPQDDDQNVAPDEGEEASNVQVPQQMEVSTLNNEPQESQEPQPIIPSTPTVTVNSTETDNTVAAVNESLSEAMEIDAETTEHVEELKSLSGELGLEDLWATLSKCLVELGETPDTHAVLVLQPAVEAFFLVHASAAVPDKKAKPSTPQESREAQLAHLQHEIAPLSPLPASQLNDDGTVSRTDRDGTLSEADSIASDAEKFLKFAETHRSVLNQILRQSTVHLADGPFSVLVDHTRLLDFDIKRKYFRTELERADDGIRREDLAVHVRREHVFEDSFRELHRRSPDEWKNRFYIVFEGEEGQDAGGLLREWYVIISREIFNPMYALFCISPGDRVTYMINPSSHCNSNHLSYFKFVGRVIAKAIYDNKLLECYFTRSFYKHILGKMVRVADMESEDYSFYQGLIYLLEHIVADLGYELTFSTEVQEFGVTEARDLKPGGRNIAVTEENKLEYIRLVCQEKMTGAIKKQLNSFLEGFYDIIPKRLISIFNEQELELLISGLPTIDIDDLKNNTEYHKYHPNSLQIQWFWRALRSFDQAERAKLVQFVTGTSKVPLQGFSALEGMNGTQKFQIHRDDRSTDRLPSAHTCFNQLDLPVYETYDKLRHYLLKAIQECSEGFGFA